MVANLGKRKKENSFYNNSTIVNVVNVVNGYSNYMNLNDQLPSDRKKDKKKQLIALICKHNFIILTQF